MLKLLPLACIVGALLGVLNACTTLIVQIPPVQTGHAPVTANPTPSPNQASTGRGTGTGDSPIQAMPAISGLQLPPDTATLGATLVQAKSRWVPVRFAQLPGWGQDNWQEGWNAWVKSCERSNTALTGLCPQVLRLSTASAQEQLNWIHQHLQPYRVEPLSGNSEGLLTGYYEPILKASRTRGAGYTVPLYRPPADFGQKKPWYSRQEIDTLPQARAALQGRAIVYLADPVDALVLQIQGSGRILVTEADGSVKTVRLAYAGTNDQPYKSVGRWLLDQGAIKDASWPGIKAWIATNPQRVNEMLWSNPRVVFFKEEVLDGPASTLGPKGAQGVSLTPGRSIAVDKASIPYGTPVWLASPGPAVALQRLVLAQDTGSAIVGAVRADYFAGWAEGSGELAGRLKQTLKLWVLWPK